MAKIAFPNRIPVQSFNLALDWPGQISHRSITGRVTVIPRGVGRFVGAIAFGPLHHEEDRTLIREMETFLDETEGLLSDFDIPLTHRQSTGFLPRGYVVTLTSGVVAGRNTIMTVSAVTDGGAAYALPNGLFQRGDYFNVITDGKARLLRAVAPNIGNRITATPPVAAVGPGSVMRPREFDRATGIDFYTPIINARRTDATPQQTGQAEGVVSPITIQFEELI